MKNKIILSAIQQGICLFFCLTVGLLPLTSLGQDLDSLKQVLKTKKLTDTEKIRLYDILSKGYVNLDLGKSLHYSKIGREVALRAKDEHMEGVFYQNIGSVYLMGSNNDSASLFLDKALVIAQRQRDETSAATVYRLYGSLHVYQNRYDSAMVYYKKSAAIFEKIKNNYELCKVYDRISGVYVHLNNDDLALIYLKKAELLAVESGNKDELANIYTNLGALYRGQGKIKEESVRPMKQALKIYQELCNKFGEIRTLSVMASTYSYFEDYEAAKSIAKQALRKTETAGLLNLAATNAAVLSAAYYYTGNYNECISTGLKVLQMDSTNISLTKHAHIHLSLAYGRLGRIDSMEHYVNRFLTSVQTQYNESYQDALSEMEVKYETEKKNLQIAALERQRQLYIWLGIAGAAILLVALAFAFIRYRLAVSKRKLAEEEAQRMEQEKQLVAVQATLDGEAAERTRLARDLHDGLGGMLSAVKMNLPQMKGNALLETVDMNRFQTALGMLDDSIRELRRVAHHMMPESLLRYGLKVSLADFCAAIPAADFHYFGDEARLPNKLEIMIYRCIHELVNNALKYAEAEHINVQLVQEPDRVSFTVQDDGKGFDQHSISEGMGLRNIRQRLEAFQGELNIYSTKNGTEIHIELKLTKDEQDD